MFPFDARNAPEKALGPEHPSVASVLHNLGSAEWGEGNRTEAAKLYKRSIAIRRKTLPANHPFHLQTLAQYRDLLEEMGKKKDAKAIDDELSKIRGQ